MSKSEASLAMLVRSSVRVRLLTELVQSPKSASDLERDVDATRRSVLRNLNQLETEGWIRSVGDCYHLVPFAEDFVADLIEYLERADRIQDLISVLEHAPEDIIEISPAVLEQCEIIVRQQSDPAAPVDEISAQIRSAGTVYTLVPTVTRQLVDAHETAIHRESKVEVVVGLIGLDAIQSSKTIQPSSAFLRSLYVNDQPTEPVGLIRTDDRTSILVYDKYGTLHGTIAGSHDPLQAWGMTYFEERRKTANPADLSDF